jgi:hypothetical protein
MWCEREFQISVLRQAQDDNCRLWNGKWLCGLRRRKKRVCDLFDEEWQVGLFETDARGRNTVVFDVRGNVFVVRFFAVRD